MGCSLWLTLEAERNDRTYLNPPTQFEPITPRVITKLVKPSRKEREERDKLLFNAGRYAAGARDLTATRANEQLEKEL